MDPLQPRGSNSRRRFLQTAAVLAVQSAIGSSAAVAASAAPSSDVIAETTYGKVRGILSGDGVRTFRGIPYGGDTSGQNRFMPPPKPQAWTGVRDALEFGPIAPQSSSTNTVEFSLLIGGPTEGRQAEDCLVLNIWTTGDRASAKLPVYVRIHGGGFGSGSGHRPLYLGHNAARKGVVYVSLNHRVDLLGYLDLSRVGGERFVQSGNAGILDLVSALEWIRDNIENFGGDPRKVMLAGESGGGSKISTLLGTVPAKGLFHRAVIESGPALTVRSSDEAAELTNHLLRMLDLNASQISTLQGLPFRRLYEAYYILRNRRWRPGETPPGGGFAPVVDGKLIPAPMFQPTATTLTADVPLIIGYNKDEGTFVRSTDADLYRLDRAGLLRRVGELVGEAAAPEFIATYQKAYPDASLSQLMIQIATDASFGMRSVTLAERKAALKKAPVFMYRFDWQSPAFEGKFGASHGTEIPFVTSNISELGVITRDLPEAHELSKKMFAAWAAFAASGAPNVAGAPKWGPYSADNRTVMLFDKNIRTAVDPQKADIRKAWANLPEMPA